MIFYNSPIKIEFNDDGLIVDGKKHPFSVRMLSELDEVLMEELHPKDDKPIYLMYRDVYKTDDMRYDITVIASRVLGKEYARTYGHYQPPTPRVVFRQLGTKSDRSQKLLLTVLLSPDLIHHRLYW